MLRLAPRLAVRIGLTSRAVQARLRPLEALVAAQAERAMEEEERARAVDAAPTATTALLLRTIHQLLDAVG